MYFRYFVLGKGRGPSFEQWLENKMKMWKEFGQKNGQPAIRKAHLSFQLRFIFTSKIRHDNW